MMIVINSQHRIFTSFSRNTAAALNACIAIPIKSNTFGRLNTPIIQSANELLLKDIRLIWMIFVPDANTISCMQQLFEKTLLTI